MQHPVRRRLIEVLWRSSEPLSPRRLHGEDAEDESLTSINYHLRVLERDGIAKLDREVPDGASIQRYYVLDGPNSAEAIRRLQLT